MLALTGETGSEVIWIGASYAYLYGTENLWKKLAVQNVTEFFS